MIQWAKAVVSQAAIAIQNAWLFEQVRDGREHLQALSRRLVEVQEMERHYIARELHDDAGQALASLTVGLRLLERDGADRPAVIARARIKDHRRWYPREPAPAGNGFTTRLARPPGASLGLASARRNG